MNKNFLILSDMYTVNPAHNAYMTNAKKMLHDRGNVIMLSSRQLANISSEYSDEEAHKLFVERGIDTAAHSITKEKICYDIVLGFSVGGTILWKAIENNNVFAKRAICVSATRLRYEKKALPIETVLIYGAEDVHAPNAKLINKLSTEFCIIPGASHDFYLKETEYLSALLKNKNF